MNTNEPQEDCPPQARKMLKRVEALGGEAWLLVNAVSNWVVFVRRPSGAIFYVTSVVDPSTLDLYWFMPDEYFRSPEWYRGEWVTFLSKGYRLKGGSKGARSIA